MSAPCTDPARLDAIARTVHAAMQAWSAAHGQDKMPDWDDAPDWMHASTRESVQFVIDNPDATDGHQHDQWMAQKLRDGWTFGPKKNEKKKTHPMLVDFQGLPDMEKRKDTLVKAIVLALI